VNDSDFLEQAIALSKAAPPSATAFAVGCVIAGPGGNVLATGYSREFGEHWHAEEVALSKAGSASLAGATLYSSLEPCSTRKSRPVSCTQLILDAGIPRVVFALREPPTFVDCCGAELLAAAGVEVVELPDYAERVRAVNRDLM
jgi:diaminohydroxyphosphoribosylaminopyrimidine deaminase/5-amino-6-(5-phosphoribosylamino)uracil reductase